MTDVLRELHAWVRSRHVGVLQEIRPSSLSLPEYRFIYDSKVKKEDFVSWTMPVAKKEFVVKRFFPTFDANLPEGARLSMLQRAGKLVRTDDSFGIAAIVGSFFPGVVQLTVSGDAAPSPLPTVPVFTDSDGAQKWFARIMTEYGFTHGISGVMEKMFTGDPGADAKIAVTTATHIVKTFDANVYPFLNTNEWLCLKAARYSGLEVPNATLSSDGSLLFVERFDLVNGERIRFEEMGSLSGRLSREKYMGTHEDMSNSIEDFVSIKERAQYLAKISLLKNIALTVAVGNGDFHIKNIGLLGEGHHVRLSPTYDVVSTLAYLHDGETEAPALNLSWDNYSKRWWSGSELMAFAENVLYLDNNDAANALFDVSKGVKKGIDDIVAQIATHPDFANIGNKMKLEWELGIHLVLPDTAKPSISPRG
jgi:serine/threonine-protein kinase HipA